MSDWYDSFLSDIGISPDTTSSWSNASSPSNNDILWDTGYFGDVTADYSNEGNNYPTTGSTQGPGGSPVNASIANSGISSLSGLFKALTQDKSGNLDYGKIIPLIGGLAAMSKSNQRTMPSGYQGGIPTYTAARQAPGAGQKISGNVTYTRAAEGGELRTNGFIFPADVVSHLGNGSSDAGLKVLASKLGATPIKGAGDGMSDSIPTTIDGKEKALVAHEEAYLSPEKVARIGGGDAKKGAQKLRQMMERIREARTGTKEQGKQINPNRFMPGGEIKTYADGGTTSGVGTAASAGVTGTESNLSNWAGPYVTDMLAKGKALSELPFEQYSGPLTAGPSALQTQAFNQAANLQTPTAIGQAAQTTGDIAQKAQNLGYSPTSFTNQFTAPGAYTTGAFNTGTFGTEQAQQYMNPYLESALAPQLAELQRQNKIANLADMAKVTRAGALGGGRQALMQTENTRNLLDKINQVTGQGYSTAYDKAMAQFNADQQRAFEAQRAAEQSRQFGATQGLTAAQTAAQYGQAAADAAERSRQFGSTLGLQGLQAATQAAQTQGQLGATQQQADIAGLKAISDLGATQRGISAEDIAAQKAQFEEARLNPYKMVQFQQSLLSGLPLAAQTYNMAPTNDLTQFGGGVATLATLLKNLGIQPST